MSISLSLIAINHFLVKYQICEQFINYRAGFTDCVITLLLKHGEASLKRLKMICLSALLFNYSRPRPPTASRCMIKRCLKIDNKLKF